MIEKHVVDISANTTENITLAQAEIDARAAEERTPAETTVIASLSLLGASDTQMARVSEDLIQILINKGIISMTDFSAEAQAVIAEREQYRADIAGA